MNQLFHIGAWACSLALSLGGAALAQDTTKVEPPRGVELPQQKKGEPISFVPLPVWATLPNEGSTYGFMPVFLTNDSEGEIKAITAPSVTWNDVTHVTGTGRYFQFPNTFEERLFQASYGTRLFREATADWLYAPTQKGRNTFLGSFNYRKDPFRRFFGIGMNTSKDDESSYTLEGSKLSARVGHNLTDRINAYGILGASIYQPENDGVEKVVKTQVRFPEEKGIGGSTAVWSALGARYDTRPAREYSTTGVLLDASLAGTRSSVAKNNLYGLAKLEGRMLWEEASRLSGAFRAHWSHAYGSDIPYYERPTLGGSYLLRGFSLDRFIDNAAWTFDFEQRITALILHVEGSTVHVRIDPFVTVGQVYHHGNEMFSRTQVAPGVGFRMFSPPNVIGRIDIAKGGPDLNIFVELGYPF